MQQISIGDVSFLHDPTLRRVYDWTEGLTKYDLVISSSFHDMQLLQPMCENLILFDANLSRNTTFCEMFYVLEKGKIVRYIWTSFKGIPKKIQDSGMDRVYDLILLENCKKSQRVLSIGNAYEAAYGCWKNDLRLDAVATTEQDFFGSIEKFKRLSVAPELIF